MGLGYKRVMFSRQRALLSIIDAAGGRASHLRVTKWAFAVRHETGSGGGDTFYDFLPYKYGPFSFSLYQEAGKLCREGLMAEVSDDTWAITDAGRRLAAETGPEVAADVRATVSKLGRMSAGDLLRWTYDRHPWFTVLSEVERRQSRPVGNLGVWTAGYEGLSVDAFLNLLIERGIRRLADVRNHPVARRYGFHGRTLAGLCGKVGIEYVHLPRLGIPSDQRRHIETANDYATLFADYERHLDLVGDAVRHLAGLVEDKPTVLVCVEADPDRCHRSRLARRAAAITGLPVRDLGERGQP
jgi:uncharacterized protein (DUF488 family)